MKNIQEFISQFTEKTDLNIKKIRKKYYHVPEHLEHISLNERKLHSIGIFLGEEDKEFKPSLALLKILSESSNKKIVVDDKVEWLFLCKRDIFEDNAQKKTNAPLVLVQNQQDENLGLAKKINKGNKTIYKNILDRGNFLRRES